MLSFQGIAKNTAGRGSPMDISSLIDVLAKEDQEAFSAPLSNGVELFRFRHSSEKGGQIFVLYRNNIYFWLCILGHDKIY